MSVGAGPARLAMWTGLDLQGKGDSAAKVAVTGSLVTSPHLRQQHVLGVILHPQPAAADKCIPQYNVARHVSQHQHMCRLC